MYITNLLHVIDNQENFPKKYLREAKKLAVFLPEVVDYTTRTKPLTLTQTKIHCFKEGCHGMVDTALRPKTTEIHWFCPVCENEGLINGWEGTEWDNLE